MKRTLACLFHRPTFSVRRPSLPIVSGPCSSHRPMKDEHPGPPLNHTTTGSLTGSLSDSAKKYEMCRVASLPFRYPAYRAERNGSLHLGVAERGTLMRAAEKKKKRIRHACGSCERCTRGRAQLPVSEHVWFCQLIKITEQQSAAHPGRAVTRSEVGSAACARETTSANATTATAHTFIAARSSRRRKARSTLSLKLAK